MNDISLSKIWWLWIPIGFAVLQIGLEILLPHDVLVTFLSEGGPHEMLQFFVVGTACVVACLTLLKMKAKDTPWLFSWVALAALCCLYVAGEEISWGQHVLQWSTPEFWHTINDQGETNLHNTSSWLDQKPRLMLEIGVLVGGLIVPLLLRFKPKWVPKKFTPIYATEQLMVTAGLAVLVKVIDKVDQETEATEFFHRASEMLELYLFYFVFLYLIILKKRLSVTKH